jgi:hypothetical protein
LGDSRLKISAVGKLLVHYKQCKGAAASPVCLCGKSKFEELLRRHRAVLLTEAENQARSPRARPARGTRSPAPRRAQKAGELIQTLPRPYPIQEKFMSRFPFRPHPSREPAHRRNGKIRAREVRVLDENRKPIGVMPLNEALRLAQTKGLDLVEIAPTAVPPVCRIVEYGKFQYEESKKKKDSQARQTTNQMKEVQLTANIDPHDLGIKIAARH